MSDHRSTDVTQSRDVAIVHLFEKAAAFVQNIFICPFSYSGELYIGNMIHKCIQTKHTHKQSHT